MHVIKGRGVKLYKPPHSSQTSVYSFFKQEDMRFRVLEQLLQGNIRTVTELADVLYVQVATISSVLREVQEYLNHFDLELHKKPLRIVGIEAHIVYMFYELYFTTYGWDKWPFSDEFEIFSYVKNIEQKLDIQFYPIYKQRLAYLLAIAVQRKKKGDNISVLPIHEALIIETPFYHKIKALPSVLCGVSLTKTDKVVMTIAVNCCMFVYSNRSRYKEELLQYYYNGTSMLYQYVKDLVVQLENEFNMLFHRDEEFLFYLLQYIRQISYRYQFIPTITSPTSEWHEKVKQIHPVTFEKVQKV
ncbi:helix-turn-helix domain-containing protein [Bacillus cereus]